MDGDDGVCASSTPTEDITVCNWKQLLQTVEKNKGPQRAPPLEPGPFLSSSCFHSQRTSPWPQKPVPGYPQFSNGLEQKSYVSGRSWGLTLLNGINQNITTTVVTSETWVNWAMTSCRNVLNTLRFHGHEGYEHQEEHSQQCNIICHCCCFQSVGVDASNLQALLGHFRWMKWHHDVDLGQRTSKPVLSWLSVNGSWLGSGQWLKVQYCVKGSD